MRVSQIEKNAAGLVVIDWNPFAIPPEETKEGKVKITILDGEIVY